MQSVIDILISFVLPTGILGLLFECWEKYVFEKGAKFFLKNLLLTILGMLVSLLYSILLFLIARLIIDSYLYSNYSPFILIVFTMFLLFQVISLYLVKKAIYA